MCYNGFVASALFFRALPPMASRHAVLLTPSLFLRPIQPLSCSQLTRETPLIPVFVFKTLRTLSFSVSGKSCVCRSYENGRGGYQQFPFRNSAPCARQLAPQLLRWRCQSFLSLCALCVLCDWRLPRPGR